VRRSTAVTAASARGIAKRPNPTPAPLPVPRSVGSESRRGGCQARRGLLEARPPGNALRHALRCQRVQRRRRRPTGALPQVGHQQPEAARLQQLKVRPIAGGLTLGLGTHVGVQPRVQDRPGSGPAAARHCPGPCRLRAGPSPSPMAALRALAASPMRPALVWRKPWLRRDSRARPPSARAAATAAPAARGTGTPRPGRTESRRVPHPPRRRPLHRRPPLRRHRRPPLRRRRHRRRRAAGAPARCGRTRRRVRCPAGPQRGAGSVHSTQCTDLCSAGPLRIHIHTPRARFHCTQRAVHSETASAPAACQPAAAAGARLIRPPSGCFRLLRAAAMAPAAAGQRFQAQTGNCTGAPPGGSHHRLHKGLPA